MEMGDLNLCMLFLLFSVSLSTTLSAAADANSSLLHLSPHFNLTMSASYNHSSGYTLDDLLDNMFTLAIPTFHDAGLFFPILSSPSFINTSASSSRHFGFSLGFYFIPNSQLNADPHYPCDTDGCNLYMAVCAGSSGNMTSSVEVLNSLNLTGALTPGLAPYLPYGTVDGYAAPVWVANQERPIRHADQASLIVKLVADSKGSKVQELQLRDGENVVWKVSNVDTMEMQEDTGQLVLYNSSNLPVWQSSLADTLVQGQMLTEGKDQLVSNDSSYVARMEKGGLVLYMNKIQFNSREGQPPPYWVFPLDRLRSSSDDPCSNSPEHAVVDTSGEIHLYPGSCSTHAPFLLSSAIQSGTILPYYNSWTFWRLESDGMLYNYAVYSPAASTDGFLNPVSVTKGSLGIFNFNNSVQQVIKLLSLEWGNCNLPMACGPLGVCTPGAQPLCSCSSLGPDFEPKSETSLFQGCKRTLDLPNCTFGNGHNTSSNTDFVQLNSTASILLFNEWTLNNSRTPAVELSACKQSCSSDCSCTGFFYQMNTSSCFFITDGITLLTVVDKNYTSFQDTTKLESSTVFGKDYVTFLKVASGSKTSIIPKTSSRAALIIALSVTMILSALVCLVLGMAGYLFRARRKRYVLTSRLSKEELKELEDILPLLPSRYSYQDLFQATEGFSKLLGAGGCGSVYAGVLPDGRKIAVKKLQVVLQGAGHSKQFLAEIATIGHTGHHNIVRLVGFCWEVSQRLLVYEYVERGSLDRWIFMRELAAPIDDTSAAVEAPFLDWKTRYNVALGIVRGLNYLHEDCEPPILHFDIKPQNILLDNDFVAKLADFGMSRLIERDMSAVVTGMRGTPGYIAPEWSSHGKVSKKSDVFSMGMVFLAEIVGGRKNLDFSLLNSFSDPNEQQAWHFPSWAAQKCEQGQMMELVDRRLHRCGFDAAQALKLIYIAFWCIQEDPATRPNASTIVQWLEGSSIIVEQPPFSVALNSGSRPIS